MNVPEKTVFDLPDNLEELSVSQIESIAQQAIDQARVILGAQNKLTRYVVDALYRLRDAYNEVLGAEDENGDEDEGNPMVFAGFKEVLQEGPKKESVGRPFSKHRDFNRNGETLFGGNRPFHRKP